MHYSKWSTIPKQNLQNLIFMIKYENELFEEFYIYFGTDSTTNNVADHSPRIFFGNAPCHII